jgi:putative FmdB family regulatory protein
MPLYEYKCDNCGELFEVKQKFADEPVSVHEKCGGPVHRLMSTPSFQFKGSGWYVTDYGKGNNGAKKSDKESREKESKEGKESKPSSDTKSDTKTTESKPAESKSAESKSVSDKPKSE